MRRAVKSRPDDQFGGKRERVICGKISLNLFSTVKGLIDGNRFCTTNDFIEEAIWDKVNQLKKEKTEGGC